MKTIDMNSILTRYDVLSHVTLIQPKWKIVSNRLDLSIYLLLLAFCGFVHGAGGRGGAITRGGGGGIQGPNLRYSENEGGGSLNVILVVILPVVQMFIILVFIIVARICYQNFCLKYRSKPTTYTSPPVSTISGNHITSKPSNL
ncbi:uncharacterized protein LOC141850973 [Brevipalpus obovatus]|uniref:uncharacterized protein LOC141850973 n=1 Tax=Brevipalpus obovatus TaxID=246614 RepID=UPI003D9E2BD7